MTIPAMTPLTVTMVVDRAKERLLRAGIGAQEAGAGAEILARHALGWDRATFFSNRHLPAPEQFLGEYAELIARRERREPVSQITGVREFWGRDFEVTRDVLTPRPETELIIEEALALLDRPEAPSSIVDVGTGTGCLAVTLAIERPASRVIGTDISAPALEVASRNARRHGVAERIDFHCTDMLAGVPGQPDLIVSNPPYVPSRSAPALTPEVRDHEPSVALFGGLEGLDAIRRLLRDADNVIRPGGWVILEFGNGQEDQLSQHVAALRRLMLWQIRADLQGIPRTAVLRARSE